jgi:hypothetical protein
MRAPLLILVAAVLVAGSGLAILNNACKTGYRTWCAPTAGVRHHLKTGHSANPGGAADRETAKPRAFQGVGAPAAISA